MPSRMVALKIFTCKEVGPEEIPSTDVPASGKKKPGWIIYGDNILFIHLLRCIVLTEKNDDLLFPSMLLL